MHSFRVYFDGQTSFDTTGTKGNNPSSADSVRFPNGLETLLERVEVRMQGPQVDGNSTQEVGFVASMLKSIRGYQDKRLEKNVATRELYDDTFLQTGEEQGFFCIDFFPGFISECKPRCLDASMLPQIEIHLTFASADKVLQKVNGSSGTISNITYTLNKCYATINVHEFQNSSYKQLLNMSGGDTYIVPFPS